MQEENRTEEILDFDEASREWRKNKKSIKSSFVYVCEYIHTKGKSKEKRCKKVVQLHDTFSVRYCKKHIWLLKKRKGPFICNT